MIGMSISGETEAVLDALRTARAPSYGDGADHSLPGSSISRSSSDRF